jgi:FkbM family methyltransferase
MKAYLFDDHMVEIDPRAAEIGGSFQARKNGIPAAWDEKTLKFFYEQAAKVEYPVVLDVGANTGSFTLLATLHPGMKVWAFEPNPEAVVILGSSCGANGLFEDRVIIKAHALGGLRDHTARIQQLCIPKNNQSGLATLAQSPARFKDYTIEITTIFSIDDYYRDGEWCHFIKIDTEGYELFVLRGGEKTIRFCKPQMLIEYYAPNTRQFGYEPKAITDLLESWGAKWEQVSNEDIWVTWDD